MPHASKIKSAEHITHQHLTAVTNTLLSEMIRKDLSKSIRILEFGCGDGKLLCRLLSSLSVLHPTVTFDLFGLDVSNAGQQEQGFFKKTINRLNSNHQEINWVNKLELITTQQQWPYPADSFDFIISNQVMEHINDYDFVFSEIARCLRLDGVSINLFPTQEVLWEGHALMPLVHQISDVNRRANLMLFFARIGFKRQYYREMNRRGWKSLREFAQMFSRVLETETNYVSTVELRSIAERAHLEISFDFTKDFLGAKVLSYIGKQYHIYHKMHLAEKISFHLIRRLTSVTVLLRKTTYNKPIE